LLDVGHEVAGGESKKVGEVPECYVTLMTSTRKVICGRKGMLLGAGLRSDGAGGTARGSTNLAMGDAEGTGHVHHILVESSFFEGRVDEGREEKIKRHSPLWGGGSPVRRSES